MTKRKGKSGNKMSARRKFVLQTATEAGTKGPKNPKLEPYTQDYAARVKEFYSSQQWRFLRYDVFLRDGRICALCGATPEDGTRLHIDHIIPLRQDWGLRLKEENLQVLCEECNHGKGSTDSTDWRPKRGLPSQY